MNSTPPNNHFNLNSIRQSLKYFLFGKGTNVFLSLAILFSLAALMPQADYAAFVSWQALVLLVGLVSTFGIQAVMHRFLPELRSNGNRLIYRLLTIGVSLRFVLALAIVGILLINLPLLTSALNVPDQGGLLGYFLLIGALRITGLSMSQACDALLWQRLTQVSLVLVNLTRVLGILLVYLLFSVDLKSVILVELVAELLFLVLLINIRVVGSKPTTSLALWWLKIFSQSFAYYVRERAEPSTCSTILQYLRSSNPRFCRQHRSVGSTIYACYSNDWFYPTRVYRSIHLWQRVQVARQNV